MKKIFCLIFIILLTALPSYAEDASPYIDGESEYNENVEKIITGKMNLNPIDIIKKGWNMLCDEVIKSKSIIADIIIIAAVSGVLNVLQTSFGEGEAKEAAFFVCFGAVAVAVLNLLHTAVGYGAEVVDELCSFITKICPVITILLISSGKAASASSFYPVLSASIYAVSMIIEHFIIPLVYMSAVLGIVNNISKRVQLTNLNNLIKSFSKWILTGILTVFTGINAIYGFSVPVLDAVSLKALKFTVGSVVPVVGGLVADTVETVLGGAKLMKNAVGTAGIIAVIGICLIPVIKLAVIILMLKIAAAAVEPICDKRISDMISDSAAPITTVFSMVIASGMLFIISMAIIIGAT